MRGRKKRAAIDPSCHLRAREPSDSGTNTAAPNQVLQERVRTRGPSAEEAESRPSCELVLCNFLLFNAFPVCWGLRYLFREKTSEDVFPYHGRLHYAPEAGRCQTRWRSAVP